MSTVEGRYLLVCRNNGCVCGSESTLEEARKAAREQGCGYCDGSLGIAFEAASPERQTSEVAR